MGENTLTIGSLARRAGVNVETVRYYQRCGLLPVPARCHGQVRRYSDDVLQRLLFIRRAQRLGFSLEEVETLLLLKGANRCRDAKQLAEHKLTAITAKLEDLMAMQASLHALVARCDADDDSRCHFIESLLSA